KPEDIARTVLSSPPMTRRRFRARRSSSMAAPQPRPPARRSIAGKLADLPSQPAAVIARRGRLHLSRRVQVGCCLQRAGNGLLAMFRADLDAVGKDEFGVLDADEAEHEAQIGFQMFADRSRRARAVEAAA